MLFPPARTVSLMSVCGYVSMEFSERLSHVLRLSGLTQVRLAAESGIRQTAISKFCLGQLRPYADQVVTLARSLGCPAWVLLDDSYPLPASLAELRELSAVDLLIKQSPPALMLRRFAGAPEPAVPEVTIAPAVSADPPRRRRGSA